MAGFASTVKKNAQRKIAINMRELKAGKLHSGSAKGPVVTDPKQALAISYAQARRGQR